MQTALWKDESVSEARYRLELGRLMFVKWKKNEAEVYSRRVCYCLLSKVPARA